MSIDITTKEGWNSYLEQLCEILTEVAEDKEMRLGACSLVLTANPETGEAWPPRIYEILIDMNEDEKHKGKVVQTLAAIATAGCCIGSAFSAEGWMSVVPEGVDIEKIQRPRDNPDRKEGLFLTVDHAEFGPHSRVAMIDRVDGKRKLNPWSISGAGVIKGAFSSFVPPKHMVADPSLVEMMREGIRQLKVMDDIVPIDQFLKTLKEDEVER